MKKGTVTLAGLALMVAFGCGSGDGLPREKVSGTVTLGGKPVEAGRVTMLPADSSAGTGAAGAIEAGSFAIPADQGPVPGSYLVSISVPEAPAAGKDGGATGPASEKLAKELVPARYNTSTTLRATVEKGGKNQFTFNLEPK